MKNIFRNNKAITLIALVITIVVLVILGGTIFALALGENGLIEKTKKASEDTKKAKYKEELSIIMAEEYADRANLKNPETAFIEDLRNKIINKNLNWIKGEIIMCDDYLIEHENTETDSVSLNTLLLIPTKDGYEIKIRVENSSLKAVIESIEKANYEKWNITYDTNGADEGTVEAQSIRKGYKVKLRNASTLKKKGYSFAGWGETSNANPADAKQPGSVQEINENKTYYAIWKENTVKITYLPGAETGVTGEMPSSTPAKDSTTTLIPNTYSREGYKFAGWKDETGTPIANEATIPTTKDYTLTAQWKIIEYAITYNLNGGTLEEANPEKYTVEDEIKLNNPTKTASYIFTGWSGTGLTGTTNTTVTISKGTTGDKIYTANWTEKPVTVYLPNSDTPLEVSSSNIASKIGTTVKYNCSAGGTWRIFYLDKRTSTYPKGKYGDCSESKPYCLYIKRDDDTNLKLRKSSKNSYTNSSATTSLGKFNPLWKNKNGTINTTSEKAASYLCCSNEWTPYCDTSVAKYAIGSPSLEMYIDSYNQYKGYTRLNYKFEDGKNGYTVGENGTYNSDYYKTSKNSVENGPFNMFVTNGNAYIFLASPSRFNNDCIYFVDWYSSKCISSFDDNTYHLHPVACLE